MCTMKGRKRSGFQRLGVQRKAETWGSLWIRQSDAVLEKVTTRVETLSSPQLPLSPSAGVAHFPVVEEKWKTGCVCPISEVEDWWLSLEKASFQRWLTKPVKQISHNKLKNTLMPEGSGVCTELQPRVNRSRDPESKTAFPPLHSSNLINWFQGSTLSPPPNSWSLNHHPKSQLPPLDLEKEDTTAIYHIWMCKAKGQVGWKAQTGKA